MTVEELQALNLPIKATATTCLYVGAAIDWINSNTTLVIDKANLQDDVEALPDGAKLFICRYFEIMSSDNSIASESIGGMSQTFNSNSKTSLLYELAKELIGDYLLGQVRSVPNVSKWV